MEKKTICSLFVLIGIMMLQLQWKSEPEIIRNLHAQIEALETVVNNLKELAFSAVKMFDVNNNPKAFSKRLDTTTDFLPASNLWFFKNIIPAAEAMVKTNCRGCHFPNRRRSRVSVRIWSTSGPKIRARNPRELSAVSDNSPRFTPRSETTTRPSSKPVYKSNVPNLSTTPLPSSPDDWTTQASFPNEGTFTTNKSSVNLNPTGSRHVNIITEGLKEHCTTKAKGNYEKEK